METEKVSVEKSLIINSYKKASGAYKRFLESIYGMELFMGNIIDRVKDYADACKEKGLHPDEERPYKKPTTDKHKVLNAFSDLLIIAEALQGDWVADYDNTNQPKWFPIFKKVKGGGFAFSLSDSYYDLTLTYLGSRLCFPNEATSNYFGKQFIDTINIILLKTKPQSNGKKS